MAHPVKKSITLASRDSLLALAQTIDAAMRLEKVGFQVRIEALKTAGDIKLDGPLYHVADSATKEGRAFFTRELDEALITNRTDAAVHSFKDLPTEKIPEISDAILFSETTSADILLSLSPINLKNDGEKLVIGTSSLRRIHQLGFTFPKAKTATLRGNIVTRLKRLVEKNNGINTILIAEAGFERMKKFSSIEPKLYTHFLEEHTRKHLEDELSHFKKYTAVGLHTYQINEKKFPTAPGQGVLAFQFSKKAEQKLSLHIAEIFPEHAKIASRTFVERQVMTLLETGCHAPIGVSAFYSSQPNFHVSLCFSRKTETNPVYFAESIFLERIVHDATNIVSEIKEGFDKIFWWGKTNAVIDNPKFQFINAIEERYLNTDAQKILDAEVLFIVSPSIFPFLEKNPQLLTKDFFTAGEETSRRLKEKFPQVKVYETGKGFSSALDSIKANAVWLGSLAGLSRAQEIARGCTNFRFVPVYENLPTPYEKILSKTPILKQLKGNTLHALTSGTAARSFVEFYKKENPKNGLVSCFGNSAQEVLKEHGIPIYHLSEAPNFKLYTDELLGNTNLMHHEEINGT
ncbi:MAG: Porphobilinogen deaminase [Turneriella sp.]|nr:Porphobilinogen deaminase [Turneriella sp.]